MLNLHFFLALVFLCYNHSVSAVSCYECQSTFPASSVCLPTCTSSYRPDSTCVLIRNISLDANLIGSLRAAHIADVSTIPSVTEKSFIFGEEAVFQNPSIGWDWEYGPITYGCDTNGCNEPGDVNRLPNALNARISTSTLEEVLLGDLVNNCYVCDTCLDSDIPNTNMSVCSIQQCLNHACGFVATRNSPSSTAQCGNSWHYRSYCVGSREPAQVDMTLIYYIRSKTHYLYQMEGVCLNNNCNNFTTFRQLNDAITVDPDLTCLIDYGNVSSTLGTTTASPTISTITTTRSSGTTTTTRSPETTTTTRSPGSTTITRSPASTTTTRSPASTTTTRSPASTSTTRSPGTTTTRSPGTTTTTSTARATFIDIKLFILILSFSFYIMKF